MSSLLLLKHKDLLYYGAFLPIFNKVIKPFSKVFKCSNIFIMDNYNFYSFFLFSKIFELGGCDIFLQYAMTSIFSVFINKYYILSITLFFKNSLLFNFINL